MMQNIESLAVDRQAFTEGRIAGGVVAVVQGIGEATAGGGTAGGGVVACATGVGCAVGAPAMAVGGAAIYHGAATALSAAGDIGIQTALLAKFSTQGHHPWPKYLGGPKKQTLLSLPTKLHEKYHAGLDKIWRRFDGRLDWDAMTSQQQQEVLESLRDYNRKFDMENGTSTLNALEQALKEAGLTK